MVPSGALTPHAAIAQDASGLRIALERVLDAHEDKDEREKAVAALRQEIPGFDARVKDERTRASVKVDAEGKRGAPPGNRNAAKGDENKVDNINFVSDGKRKGGTRQEYIIARLKRDAATDTHAAALLGSIEAPSASWCPQVPPGQATPHLDLAHDTQGLGSR